MICNEISFQLSHHLAENYFEAGTPIHWLLGKRISSIRNSLQIKNENKFKSLSTENVFHQLCLFLV